MLAAVMDGDPDARHPLVERYFRAMQRGQEGEEELVALFAEDAVYVEPFSDEQAPHVGRAEIQVWLHASWDRSPPELTLRVDRVRVDGDLVEADWTCTSPALPAPIEGVDRYTIRDGRIARLETRFRPATPSGPAGPSKDGLTGAPRRPDDARHVEARADHPDEDPARDP
jgi:ketosteroid isomerase-like protein